MASGLQTKRGSSRRLPRNLSQMPYCTPHWRVCGGHVVDRVLVLVTAATVAFASPKSRPVSARLFGFHQIACHQPSTPSNPAGGRAVQISRRCKTFSAFSVFDSKIATEWKVDQNVRLTDPPGSRQHPGRFPTEKNYQNLSFDSGSHQGPCRLGVFTRGASVGAPHLGPLQSSLRASSQPAWSLELEVGGGAGERDLDPRLPIRKGPMHLHGRGLVVSARYQTQMSRIFTCLSCATLQNRAQSGWIMAHTAQNGHSDRSRSVLTPSSLCCVTRPM